MPENGEKRPLVVLPYTSRIDRLGTVRISSHTALVTDAAGHKFSEGQVSKIYYPGENTFGPYLPATSWLGARRLVNMGVPAEAILINVNLNETESQLLWVLKNGVQNPWVLDLSFHQERTQNLMRQLGLKGEAINAEELILKYHPRSSAPGLEKFIKTSQNIFGISKVDLAEEVISTGTKFGKPGKMAVHLLRTVMGADGATVTDYHFVGPAKKHLQVALDHGLTPH